MKGTISNRCSDEQRHGLAESAFIGNLKTKTLASAARNQRRTPVLHSIFPSTTHCNRFQKEPQKNELSRINSTKPRKRTATGFIILGLHQPPVNRETFPQPLYFAYSVGLVSVAANTAIELLESKHNKNMQFAVFRGLQSLPISYGDIGTASAMLSSEKMGQGGSLLSNFYLGSLPEPVHRFIFFDRCPRTIPSINPPPNEPTTQPLQQQNHSAQVSGRIPGDALRHGDDQRGHEQAASWHRKRLVRGQFLQHAPARFGR